MRARLASLLFMSVALTAAAASARPPKAAASRVVSNVATPVSARAAADAKPTSFVKSDGGFKDNFGGEWLGKSGKGDAQDVDRLGNEQAAAGIYRLAEGVFGTTAPEVCAATVDGKALLMSKRVVLSDQKQLTEEQLKKFGDGFVIDAWIANWDIGSGWRLTADASGRPVRVDSGGAGLFRVHGEPKGTAFTDDVGELTSMRDPLRPNSAGFRKVTDKDVKDQLQKFASWYPPHKGEIDSLVDATGMSPTAATLLKTKLAARAQWLIAKAKK